MSKQMTTEDPRFAPNAQAFLQCMTCDVAYPPGTERCATCDALLSSVRRCPGCERILSSKHEQCIYCAASFLAEHQPEGAEQIVAIRPRGQYSAQRQRRAAFFGIGIFVATFLIGLAVLHIREQRERAPALAMAYTTKSVGLRMQPRATSATVVVAPAGTVLNIVSSTVDDQGGRWFEVSQESQNVYVPAADVAPPKANDKEGGEKILRFWLVGMTDSTQSTEAVQAVNYFCQKYNSPPSCQELRWLAAEQIKKLANGSNKKRELQARVRELYQGVANDKGLHAKEAEEALASLEEPRSESETREAAGARRSSGAGLANQYSLVDRTDVQVRVQDLGKAIEGATITAPVAHEVVINGQTAVPRNAMCSMTVLSVDSKTGTVLLRLTNIQIRGKYYAVSANSQPAKKSGDLLSFRLDTPLLIGR